MGNDSQFRFKPFTFQTKWLGRYRRIEGNTTAFKIKHTYEYGFWPVFEWDCDDERLTCLAVECNDVEELVSAVNKAKSRLSSSTGGSFCINEYGQVIVPSGYGDGNRLLVGEIEGVLLFENDYGETIDLSDDAGLTTGDPWEKPYIGMQYNLSKGSNIYYFDYAKCSDYLPTQDEDLIKKLRKIRRYGAVRFIVNPYGLVLTKSPEGEFSRNKDRWLPVYVGRINKKLWFRKEF